MNIIGMNGGFAQPPSAGSGRRFINDGSAALLVDGHIACATIEERHTRRRYEGGFRLSARACLRSAGKNWHDLDAIGFSTCCDLQWPSEDDVIEEIATTYNNEQLGKRFCWSSLRGKIACVDHHESHAMLAFVGAGVEQALVAVIDGMGNRRSCGKKNDWWRGAFQRQSYYLASWIGDRVRLELVDEDCSGPEEIGIGELYRAMTHFLGWDSYQYAGKTMALAAFGNPHRWPQLKFCEVRNGQIVINMENDHNDPVRQVENVLNRYNVVLSNDDIPSPNGLPSKEKLDLVACLQAQVAAVVVERLASLCDQYDVPALCVSGGVAMNCLAMGRLARERPRLRVYVPPAPSDTGQGLGNALWIAFNEKSPFCEQNSELRRKGISTAALGPTYSAYAITEAFSILERKSHLSISGPHAPNELARAITDHLLQGRVVGLRQGRAEYGPRSLGQASILADPRKKEMHDHVNAFKRRESFRPFAPSVLAERAVEFFEDSVDSPFMSFAATVSAEQQKNIPAVLHEDNTARYQTVARDSTSLLRKVLEEFDRRTGVPVLVNTSFNRACEPMVETPSNAVRSFLESDLEVLCLGSYLASKKRCGVW